MTNWITQKKRYRAYKRRTAQLPETYQTALEALERYLFCFGPGKGDSIQAMLDDLADLFEQGAASSTPLREIVGDDPVAFAELFLANYTDSGWVTKERDRLNAAITRAEGAESR